MSAATEFHMACEQLAPLIERARLDATVHAERMLRLDSRFERILLMPRYGGKTSIGRVSTFAEHEPLTVTGGWLDEAGQSHSELARTAVGMLKLHRTQRMQFPKFNPKITLRPETWDLIKGKLNWVEPHQIAHLAFPHEAFYGALTENGAAPAALAQFGPSWLKTFCDSAGRLYPGLAFEALRLTCERAKTSTNPNTIRWLAAAEACGEFVRVQADIRYWVTYMVPGDQATLKGGGFTIPAARFQLRIRQARRNPDHQLPFGLTGPQFARWGHIAGLWRTQPGQPYYAFAPPYSIGASFLKTTLTDEGFRRMS